MNATRGNHSPPLSFIIPVLNEAGLLVSQLQALQGYREAGHELVLVDGGSSDGSATLAAPLVDVVAHSAPGRSVQMNHGAALARGEALVFLHVDTGLPAAADRLILAALAEAGWGWFDVRLDNRAWPYRLIGSLMNLRVRLTSVCTGDQALFVRRQLFDAVGGFPAIGLMEDIAISKALRHRCRPRRIATPVSVSSRAWERRGLTRTVLLMWWLRLLYFLGVSPARLVKLYYPQRP